MVNRAVRRCWMNWGEEQTGHQNHPVVQTDALSVVRLSRLRWSLIIVYSTSVILQGPCTLCFSVWHYEQCNCRVTQQCCLRWPFVGQNVVWQTRPSEHWVLWRFLLLRKYLHLWKCFYVFPQILLNNAKPQGLRLGVKAKGGFEPSFCAMCLWHKGVWGVVCKRGTCQPVGQFLFPALLFHPLWHHYTPQSVPCLGLFDSIKESWSYKFVTN